MSLAAVLFALLALATAGSALGVVLTRNVVRAAVWLLFSLAGVAGLYLLLGAEFVGAAQLIVYVGGTLVLVVFGVMLTAQQQFLHLTPGRGEVVVSALAGLALFGLMTATYFGTAWPAPPEKPPAPTVAHLGSAFLNVPEATPPAELPTAPGRPRARVAYLLPFEAVSVHLLVVLIGAAYLARAKRRRPAGVAA